MSETAQIDEAQDAQETLAVAVAELRPSLEAILMVADQPLDQVTLASAVGYPVEEVAEALAALAAEYDEQGRGFELRPVAGGWRFYTREEFAPVVEAFVLDGQQARLTQAALETVGQHTARRRGVIMITNSQRRGRDQGVRKARLLQQDHLRQCG